MVRAREACKKGAMPYSDELFNGWDISPNVLIGVVGDYSDLSEDMLEARVYGPQGNFILHMYNPSITVWHTKNGPLISAKMSGKIHEFIIPDIKYTKHFTYIHNPCRKADKYKLSKIIHDAIEDHIVCINPSFHTLQPIFHFIDKPWMKNDIHPLSVEILDLQDNRILYMHNPNTKLIRTANSILWVLQPLDLLVIYKSGLKIPESVYKTYDPCWKGKKMYKDYDPCWVQDDDQGACKRCAEPSRSYAMNSAIIDNNISYIAPSNMAEVENISFMLLLLGCTAHFVHIAI